MKEPVEGPLFTARTCREYLKMFNLNPPDLKGLRILDCPGGASSFTPIMAAAGFDVMACDIMYGEEPEILGERCREHIMALTEALKGIKDTFKWDFYKSPDEMLEKRLEACSCFEESYRLNPALYIRGDLRDLPFDDGEFDLVVSSHLLFIYEHRLDREFHRKALEEFTRVGSDVRVYPIVRENGELADYARELINNGMRGIDVDVVEVDYEFRRGGNRMLILRS